jgi:transposase InsO family protein
MKVTVRQVETPRDSVDIEDVATHASNEHGCGREFDPRAIGRHVYYAVKDPERKHINGWVAYDEQNKPVGYLVATMRESMYSFRSYAIQEMWYVLPHARKASMAGLMLLHAFDKWATERNAERIYMQVEHDQDERLIERVFKLMETMGYKKQGYIGVKIVNPTVKEERSNDQSTHRVVGADERQAAS